MSMDHAEPLPRPTNGQLDDSPYLGSEERQLLERGKAEHRETTSTAKRALQVGGPRAALNSLG